MGRRLLIILACSRKIVSFYKVLRRRQQIERAVFNAFLLLFLWRRQANIAYLCIGQKQAEKLVYPSGLKIQLFPAPFHLLKNNCQKTPKVPIKGGTKIEGRGGRKNVLKRTKTNAPTAQTNVLLNAKYLNFPIRCKNQ